MAAAETTVQTATNAVVDKIQPLSEKFATQAYEAMVTMVTKITSGVETAGEFLKGQIPDVLQQLIVYNLVISLAIFLVGLVGTISWPFFCRFLYKKGKDCYPDSHAYYMDQGDFAGILTLCAVAGSLVFLVVLITHLDWVKIWLAPKIWLIEYTADLLKSLRK